jgi:hypothetical protein
MPNMPHRAESVRTCNVTLRAKASLQSLMLQSLPELQQLQISMTQSIYLAAVGKPGVVRMQVQSKDSSRVSRKLPTLFTLERVMVMATTSRKTTEIYITKAIHLHQLATQ